MLKRTTRRDQSGLGVVLVGAGLVANTTSTVTAQLCMETRCHHRHLASPSPIVALIQSMTSFNMGTSGRRRLPTRTPSQICTLRRVSLRISWHGTVRPSYRECRKLYRNR
jgi:hypothetical protein